jgi:hypothetical protein
MTNPDNAVGTNAAYGGRTSVNAFNDDLSAWSRGIMSGWACTPDGGLVVSLGGNGTDRDVAVAEDNVGNKTSINNISAAPIKLTMSAAPGSGTRLDSIVAYVDASPQGSATITDNYEACGLIVVQGTPSASPVAPTENEIRSAITSDGASGPTAYYVVLATITMASGTTDITDGEIATGGAAGLVGEGIITADNIDFATIGLGEQHVLNLAVSLPNTAYYGHNTILSTGQQTFSGGVYLLSLPSLMVSLSASDFQAYVGYAIDGNLVQILNFAQMGTDQTLAGSVSFNVPIEIPSGNHTVTIEVGTVNTGKRITVARYQDAIKAYLVKVGV